MPAVSTAPGGYRVVWSDARNHYANAADTPEGSLAYRLYVALVPTVTAHASKQALTLGKSTDLDTKVSPDFKGYKVLFQKGKRHTFKSTYGTHEYFNGWTTLKGKTLGAGSKASFTWNAERQGHVLGPCLVQGRQEVHRRRECRTQGAARPHGQQGRQDRREVTERRAVSGS